MALGKHLVHELNYENGVDTLGRWMSHYLAELINKAENASEEHERKQAQKEAMDTIIEIWHHRTVLPGQIYPIKRYEDILTMLNLLKPNRNPFALYRNDTKKDELAASLFDGLSRIIIALLLMKLDPNKRNFDVNPVVLNSLNETEQSIIRSIMEWDELFKTNTEFDALEEEDETETINLKDISLQLIEYVLKSLNELHGEISENPPNDEKNN